MDFVTGILIIAGCGIAALLASVGISLRNHFAAKRGWERGLPDAPPDPYADAAMRRAVQAGIAKRRLGAKTTTTSTGAREATDA